MALSTEIRDLLMLLWRSNGSDHLEPGSADVVMEEYLMALSTENRDLLMALTINPC